MINYFEVNKHFNSDGVSCPVLTQADRDVIVDYLNHKITQAIYEMEDEDIEFVANSPFYHDDYFYDQARDLVLEELDAAAAANELDDFFEDEISNANALKDEIRSFASKAF